MQIDDIQGSLGALPQLSGSSRGALWELSGSLAGAFRRWSGKSSPGEALRTFQDLPKTGPRNSALLCCLRPRTLISGPFCLRLFNAKMHILSDIQNRALLCRFRGCTHDFSMKKAKVKCIKKRLFSSTPKVSPCYAVSHVENDSFPENRTEQKTENRTIFERP